MTPEEELIRAERASQILRDPLVVEAISAIKQSVIDAWRTSPIKDRDLRDYLHTMYNAAHKFEELLHSHIETGKLAVHQLKEKGAKHGASRSDPYT
jgi:hypothetical protein